MAQLTPPTRVLPPPRATKGPLQEPSLHRDKGREGEGRGVWDSSPGTVSSRAKAHPLVFRSFLNPRHLARFLE